MTHNQINKIEDGDDAMLALSIALSRRDLQALDAIEEKVASLDGDNESIACFIPYIRTAVRELNRVEGE
tara:strand:+ start:1748 stop:1954 length:207 start_codon:yes stop_codon:yes gene_type:complete